jgi:hypothetical protein
VGRDGGERPFCLGREQRPSLQRPSAADGGRAASLAQPFEQQCDALRPVWFLRNADEDLHRREQWVALLAERGYGQIEAAGLVLIAVAAAGAAEEQQAG